MSQDYSSNLSQQQYLNLKLLLSDCSSQAQLYKRIVNAPFSDKLLTTSIDLGIVVLLQVNPDTQTVDRVALSNTELAKHAVHVSAKAFHDIKIPFDVKSNLIVKAIRTNKYRITEDWQLLFNPVLTGPQARLNQANASIECSLVYPLTAGDGGALIFSFYQPRAYISADEHIAFATAYAQMVDDALLSFFQKQSAQNS